MGGRGRIQGGEIEDTEGRGRIWGERADMFEKQGYVAERRID